MFGVFLHGLERHGEPYAKDTGEIFLSLPERLPFLDRDDTSIHVVNGEQTVMDIAIQYYKGVFRNPVDLWEVIAQFQEFTIIDPSEPLPPKTVVLIPSVEYISEVAYGDSLSEFPQL